MASKHREQKVVAAVACPVCRAPKGTNCYRRADTDAGGRLYTHSLRRIAWQERKQEMKITAEVITDVVLDALSDQTPGEVDRRIAAVEKRFSRRNTQ